MFALLVNYSRDKFEKEQGNFGGREMEQKEG